MCWESYTASRVRVGFASSQVHAYELCCNNALVMKTFVV